MNIIEKIIMRNLYFEGFKYLARDKDGLLFAYKTQPTRVFNITWVGEFPSDIKLVPWGKVFFKQLTWKNGCVMKIKYD